jgi:hypothetical protein
MCGTENELKDKAAIEANFTLMEEVAAMREDSTERQQKLVNVYFSIQGLSQGLSGDLSEKKNMGVVLLAQGRGLLHTVVRLMEKYLGRWV